MPIVGRLVVSPRLLHREPLGVLAEHDGVAAPAVHGEPSPLVPVRLAEEHPGARVGRPTLDQKSGDVWRVAEALAVADQQPSAMQAVTSRSALVGLRASASATAASVSALRAT